MTVNADRARCVTPPNQTPYYEEKIDSLRVFFSQASSSPDAVQKIINADLLGTNTVVVEVDSNTLDLYGVSTRYQDAVETLDAIFNAANVTRTDYTVPTAFNPNTYVTFVSANAPAAAQ